MTLDDHIRVGKRFIPPAKKMAVPLSEVHYSEQILPEILWMSYVIHRYGVTDGVRIVSQFIDSAYRLAKWSHWPEFTFLSSFKCLSASQQRALLRDLKMNRVLSPIKASLGAFVRTFPQNNPFIFLFKEKPKSPSKKDILTAKTLIAGAYDRRSKEAVILQSISLYTGVAAGKMKYSAQSPPPDFNAIISDYEGDAGQQAAAHVRCTISQIYMVYQPNIGLEWASYFWSRGFEIEAPRVKFERHRIPRGKGTAYRRFALEYENYANGLLEQIWPKIPKNDSSHEISDVLGALLSRQAHLSIMLSRSPYLWEWNFGPLFLRTMTDCHIAIAWILVNPLVNARKFIDYGLGQTKLMIENYREGLAQESDPVDKQRAERMIEVQAQWLDGQHFAFLQDVDVGSWSGISTRQMAVDAGCLDLYRFAYTPYSNCAHNSWNHLGRIYCIPSSNPLHRFIRIPGHPDMPLDPNVFMNAAKYFEKSLCVVSSQFHISVDVELPWDWANSRMASLFKELDGGVEP